MKEPELLFIETFCCSESVLWCVATGEDIKLSISEVLTSRTFCNKMWQTLRFTLGVLGDNTTPLRTLEEVQERTMVDVLPVSLLLLRAEVQMLLMLTQHWASEQLRKVLEKL